MAQWAGIVVVERDGGISWSAGDIKHRHDDGTWTCRRRVHALRAATAAVESGYRRASNVRQATLQDTPPPLAFPVKRFATVSIFPLRPSRNAHAAEAVFAGSALMASTPVSRAGTPPVRDTTSDSIPSLHDERQLLMPFTDGDTGHYGAVALNDGSEDGDDPPTKQCVPHATCRSSLRPALTDTLELCSWAAAVQGQHCAAVPEDVHCIGREPGARGANAGRRYPASGVRCAQAAHQRRGLPTPALTLCLHFIGLRMESSHHGPLRRGSVCDAERAGNSRRCRSNCRGAP